jgi:hypothetical protein
MRDVLLTVLQDARQLLARPENNFTWSSWENAEVALREIDALIALVSNGALPDRRQLAVLFAPTGPIQEVSVNSGWSERFLELADRLDAAVGPSREPHSTEASRPSDRSGP